MGLRTSLDLKCASIRSNNVMRTKDSFRRWLLGSAWLFSMWPMAVLALEGLELRPSSKGLDEFLLFTVNWTKQ